MVLLSWIFLRFKEQANCFDAEMKGNRKHKIVVMKQLFSNKHKQRNSRSYDFEVQSLESLKYAKSLPWALRWTEQWTPWETCMQLHESVSKVRNAFSLYTEHIVSGYEMLKTGIAFAKNRSSNFAPAKALKLLNQCLALIPINTKP